MKQILSKISFEFNKFHNQSENELEISILKLKKKAQKEALDTILTEWFAVVQEVSLRELDLKHFNTQLMAGFFLHQGKIVEMKTGEGKTLASTLAITLNSLQKKGVHVVTVNDYLAARDQKWMGKIYKKLELSCGLIKPSNNLIEKQKNYNYDITYTTNSELVFDYLRDTSAYNENEIVQRKFNFCLIDEVDSILIDEARTPLILSTNSDSLDINRLLIAKQLATILEKNVHFEIDEKRKDIFLTDKGYKLLNQKIGKKTLYDITDPWILEVLNALKAKHIFKLNKDYIVLNNKIVIVDEFTGRIMEDRRWNAGIHEAIELKENVLIGSITRTKSSITYQNFFTLYPKLAGMTGTAKSAQQEFQGIYNLEVIVIPTFKPSIRKDLVDLVYQTETAKLKAILKKAKECFKTGQPLLIGTSNVEKSETLSELFKLAKLSHQILNAKPENVIRENEIIAKAGEKYAITIATNMAGRGTDILLGGNPKFQLKQLLINIFLNNQKIEEIYLQEINEIKEKDAKNFYQFEKNLLKLPYSLENFSSKFQLFYQKLYTQIYQQWEKENKDVINLGGLFIIGTERHESRRIDDQLRGRAGRQGDPGTSQFYLSLDDDLIKIFGGQNIKQWVDFLLEDETAPLQSRLLMNSLEKAQQKVEAYNYEIRKNLSEYDTILNNHRLFFFNARLEVLITKNFNELILILFEFLLDYKKRYVLNSEKTFEELFNYYFFKTKLTSNCLFKELWISNDLKFATKNFYQFKQLKSILTYTFLEIIDCYWTEHIERINYIRETINWKSYGQQNPLTEYSHQAFESFKVMFEQINFYMIYCFLKF